MADSGLIVVACTANICRSPMAEALLRHALNAEPPPLRDLRVVSAGVAARDGDTVSANSVQTLRKVGLDIANHRSQALTAEMLNEALAVFVMTETHRQIMQAMFAPIPRNIHLLREFMPRDADKQIGDPYGGSLQEYEATRDEIVEAIPSVLRFLREQVAERDAE